MEMSRILFPSVPHGTLPLWRTGSQRCSEGKGFCPSVQRIQLDDNLPGSSAHWWKMDEKWMKMDEQVWKTKVFGFPPCHRAGFGIWNCSGSTTKGPPKTGYDHRFLHSNGKFWTLKPEDKAKRTKHDQSPTWNSWNPKNECQCCQCLIGKARECCRISSCWICPCTSTRVKGAICEGSGGGSVGSWVTTESGTGSWNEDWDFSPLKASKWGVNHQNPNNWDVGFTWIYRFNMI